MIAVGKRFGRFAQVVKLDVRQLRIRQPFLHGFAEFGFAFVGVERGVIPFAVGGLMTAEDNFDVAFQRAVFAQLELRGALRQ